MIAEVSAVDISDSVIDQQNDANTKSIEDKEIGDFIPEEPANVSDSVIAQPKQCKPPQIEEVTTKVNHQGRSLEDRKTDAFLDEVHKKRVSDEIRQRNKEKKIQRESTAPSDLSCVTETSLRNHDENESNTKTVNIVHNQEKISLEDSVQKMPERLNEDISQRESNSGFVTKIV